MFNIMQRNLYVNPIVDMGMGMGGGMPFGGFGMGGGMVMDNGPMMMPQEQVMMPMNQGFDPFMGMGFGGGFDMFGNQNFLNQPSYFDNMYMNPPVNMQQPMMTPMGPPLMAPVDPMGGFNSMNPIMPMPNEFNQMAPPQIKEKRPKANSNQVAPMNNFNNFQQPPLQPPTQLHQDPMMMGGMPMMNPQMNPILNDNQWGDINMQGGLMNPPVMNQNYPPNYNANFNNMFI